MLHHFSNFKFSCLRAHPWPLHVAPLLFCALFPWRDRQYVFHKSLTLQNAIDSFIQIHATIFLSKITFCKMSQCPQNQSNCRFWNLPSKLLNIPAIPSLMGKTSSKYNLLNGKKITFSLTLSHYPSTDRCIIFNWITQLYGAWRRWWSISREWSIHLPVGVVQGRASRLIQDSDDWSEKAYNHQQYISPSLDINAGLLLWTLLT